MGHQNEANVHAYARIAETVSRDLGVDMDSLEANAWIHDEWDDTALSEDEQARREACLREAKEYGIVP